MEQGILLRLFNIIKTTENNNADSVMSIRLYHGNYCLLIQNNVGHNVLMLQGALTAGEEIFSHQTWLGNRPQVSRGYTL